MAICRIAELIVDIPDEGDLLERCKEYLEESNARTDIVISRDLVLRDRWPGLSLNDVVYMETGGQFFYRLLEFDGMMLHASAVELDGKAYLFSADCGTGKSTHTRLWQQAFGERAQVFNDDKPPLRRMDGVWYAYGAPWCGKDGINQNKKVKLAGICFLKQADHNAIRRLNHTEAVQKIVFQTLKKHQDPEALDLMLSHVDKLVREIPIYELENRPEPAAVRLSYETMLQGAQEAGL